jgi:hypothetical protein
MRTSQTSQGVTLGRIAALNTLEFEFGLFAAGKTLRSRMVTETGDNRSREVVLTGRAGKSSGFGGHEIDHVIRAHVSRFEDAGVKTAHPPSRRLGIECFDPGVVDLIFQRLTVHVERAARSPGLRNFDQGAAGRQAVADPQLRQREVPRGEILSERAVKQGVAARGQIVDHFRGAQKNGFARAAMDPWMCVRIALQALLGDKASRNRAFREASARRVDLNDGAHTKRSAVSSQLSTKPRWSLTAER